MATAAPTSRDIDDLKKSIGDESKRVDGLVDKLNEVFKHAKANDDRLEKMIKAVAARSGGGESKRIDNIVAKLNEIFLGAKKNDDRIEAMVKTLQTQVETLAKAAAKK